MRRRRRAGAQLSIDVRVQAVLEEELGKAAAEFQPKGAVGVVTNVHTGEILGLANWPDFDPNKPGAAPPRPRRTCAAAAVYEMGSTFKAFTVAIGLDTGVATPPRPSTRASPSSSATAPSTTITRRRPS
jgi:cell division protein FtsI (penicillin-binding protein 3)